MNHVVLGALNVPGWIDGIDISSCQGQAVDFNAVAKAGFRFVAVKCTDGMNEDPTRMGDLQRAREAGLRTFAYAFARVTGDPKAEMDRLWDSVGAVLPDRFVIDFEYAPSGWATSDGLAKWLCEAIQACKDKGRAPIIYTGTGFFSQIHTANLSEDQLTLLLECDLWVAQYRSTKDSWAPSVGMSPSIPKPWNTWRMWQYSGNGGYLVPGVPCDCDRNVFRGTEDEFRSFLGLPALPVTAAA